MDGLAVSFEDKVESFHARFFPFPAETDLSDAHGPYPSEVQAVEPVTTEEVVAVIAYLPTGKASGASGVPNEYLKLLGRPLELHWQHSHKAAGTGSTSQRRSRQFGR